MAKLNTDERLRRSLVKYIADRHLVLYRRTGHGLLVWKAYREYRKHKLPVPKYILERFDEIGDALMQCGTSGHREPIPVQIAKAVRMHQPKGGASRTAATLRRTERQRDIVEVYAVVKRQYDERGIQQSDTEAYHRVAEAMGLRYLQVKDVELRWRKAKGLLPDWWKRAPRKR